MRSSCSFRSARAWRAAIVIATIALWPIGTARAADPTRTLPQYLRDRWGRNAGFAAGSVYGITQTRDGYLWIAAEKGVVRFDGLRFRLFEPLQPTATTDTAALNVVPDRQGGLWSWLRRGALMRLRNGTFENVLSTSGPPELRFGVMATGTDGAVLIAIRASGFRSGVTAGSPPCSPGRRSPAPSSRRLPRRRTATSGSGRAAPACSASGEAASPRSPTARSLRSTASCRTSATGCGSGPRTASFAGTAAG